MIKVNIIGGLGNQMFQYAAGRSIADKLNVGLELDITAYENYKIHKFALNKFNIRFDKLTINKEIKLIDRLFSQIKNKIKLNLDPTLFNEYKFNYMEEINSIKDGARLQGYFQSEKYFINNYNSIKRDFTLKENITGSKLKLLDELRQTKKNSVMIHIRRGDYIENKRANKVHGLCTLDYYHRSIRMIESKFDNLEYYVFSNDINWVKENLNNINNIKYISQDDNPEVDMYLMSQCNHFIIANSTYSWWAAWLGEYAKKEIYYPDPWFEINKYNTSDLIPSGWKKIYK